jgi:uncharacterized protein YjbI with pentapeptide repeats
MPPDYSGQNLRGRFFTGQNLEGVNFSYADIRSADFTGANLRGANFSHVIAGLQKRWAIFLVLISSALVILTVFFSALVGFIMSLVSDTSNLENQIAGLTIIVVVAIIFFTIIRQGIQVGFQVAAFAVVVVAAFSFALVLVGLFFTGNSFAAVAGTVAVGGTIGGVFAVVFTLAFIGAVSVVIAVADTFAIVFVVVFVVVFIIVFGRFVTGDGSFTGVFFLAGAFAVALFSVYISRLALKGDEKHALIRNMAVAFAAIGGTSFRSTNLTDANFTGATLKSTDFRRATLTRTYFHKTKKLDRVRPGTSYLQKAKVCQVLVKSQGQDKNFDRQDLRGVNFKGANLVDASFIAANLSEANLQDANLSRAKLVQAQLDGTDFTGATLTGAYIEDWGITNTTKFDGVRCKYVYMRLPTKENPDPLRKPDNNEEVFADGEFEDFIQPIFDTLDLYHNQGVDPRAIAAAFKELAENNPSAELEIVAIERRGEDKILLRAKTAATANKSELSKEYFINYNQLKALAEKDFKSLIRNQSSQIRRLENMITTALERPNFYAETYNNQGNTTMTGDSFNQSGNFGVGINKGEINTEKLAGTINEAQQRNLADTAAEIQQLLKQLEETNPTSTETERIIVTAKAADEIRNNPTLKARVIGALKSGGKEAFKEAVDNPLVNILIAIIEGWQEA